MDKKDKKKKEPIIYEGIPCDSMEEAYFLMWVFELKKAGLVESVKRADGYSLFSGHYRIVDKIKKLKTKEVVVPVRKTILNPAVYTPDFTITWAKSPVFLLDNYARPIGNTSIVEVKPIFDQNGKTQEFVVKQKWLFSQFNTFVNLCIPQKLFKETFTPVEYLLTTVKKQKREVKWEVRTCEEYLSSLKTEINEA